MATYRLINTTNQYNFSANPPVLDRVVFTIDHIHAGDHDYCSTYEVVKFLVDRNIPVTVFMQATNPSNDHEYDRSNARMIYRLAPSLVTLGVHPKPKGNSQQEQNRVHSIIRNIIKDVTGNFPSVLSYHGSGAGPEPDITFSGIKYARGILNSWAAGTDHPKNTPVMVMNSVSRAFAYTSQRNAAGYSATIFIHTNELRNGTPKKLVFDTFIKEVLSQRINAVAYLEGMNTDFNRTVTPTPPNNSVTLGSLRLSASTQAGRRPVNANFLIEQLNGEAVDRVSNVKTQAFRVPLGQYKLTATIGNVKEIATVTLTASRGIHHIFLMPEAVSTTATTPPATPVMPPAPTPSSGSTTLGSLRLSSSTKVGRRPVNANFMIESIDSHLVKTANNLKSKAFRVPLGRYKVTAKIGSIVETATLNLTASRGIHHIFLMSPSGSNTEVTTPPANTSLLGSLRLSASTQQGRRPVTVDLFIHKLNGDAIRNVRSVTTQLFKLPAGQYRVSARQDNELLTETINLSANRGLHHIFLIPN